MSSVEPTCTGPEPQSIVARNEKLAGSGLTLAAAGPASASDRAAASTAVMGRRMSESFRFGPWTQDRRAHERAPPRLDGRSALVLLVLLLLVVELLDGLAVTRAHAAVEADVHAVVARAAVDQHRAVRVGLDRVVARAREDRVGAVA